MDRYFNLIFVFVKICTRKLCLYFTPFSSLFFRDPVIYSEIDTYGDAIPE